MRKKFNTTPTVTKKATKLLKELFPICRSITGDGVRKTLAILRNTVNFSIKEIPTGTKCYDWKIPDEWNIKDAYIKDSRGRKIVDFNKNNVHVVNYSIPINKQVTFKELDKHLHSLPDLPNAIPYRTSYYSKEWGFCITHNQYKKLDRKDTYHVHIDSTLKPGHLTYGERILKGTSKKEYLISTYCCHPSLGNDNLSGVVLWTLLLERLSKQKLKHSYRFIIVPETIGSIAYLSQNEKKMKKISGGFMITSVAGPGKIGYKETFLGNHNIDNIVRKIMSEEKISYIPYPFDIAGADETQYGAPFFRIPMGTICKDKYYEYDYYHTSLDNLKYISAKNLTTMLNLYIKAIKLLEEETVYRSQMPYCEPQLGRRGLYPTSGGFQKTKNYKKNYTGLGNELDMLRWLIFKSDGLTSILDIAAVSKFSEQDLLKSSRILEKHKLLKKIS